MRAGMWSGDRIGPWYGSNLGRTRVRDRGSKLDVPDENMMHHRFPVLTWRHSSPPCSPLLALGLTLGLMETWEVLGLHRGGR